MSKEVVVIGPTYIDHTIKLSGPILLDGSTTIESQTDYPGGTGLCYAVALCRLGNKVNFHSAIGSDQRAEAVRKFVGSERELTCHWQVFNGETDHAYVLIGNGNHKTVASHKRISNDWDVEKISISDAACKTAIVFTSIDNNIIEKTLQRLRTESCAKPFVMWAPHPKNCEHAAVLRSELAMVDHITLSMHEYELLEQKIGDPTRLGVKSVTVTNGKNGCDLITTTGRIHYDAIKKVENPIDTNGAGEAFGAGYLTGWLETQDYQAAIRTGNINGYLHVFRQASDFPKIEAARIAQQLVNGIEGDRVLNLLESPVYA